MITFQGQFTSHPLQEAIPVESSRRALFQETPDSHWFLLLKDKALLVL